MKFLVIFSLLGSFAWGKTSTTYEGAAAKMMGFGSFANDLRKLLSPELRHYGATLSAFFGSPPEVQAVMGTVEYIELLNALNSRMGDMEFVRLSEAEVDSGVVRIRLNIARDEEIRKGGTIVARVLGQGNSPFDFSVQDVKYEP